MDITQIDAITGEVTERAYTKAEKAEHNVLIAKAKAALDAEIAANLAKESSKAAVLAKLGLTAEEAALILG
jgi:hypothetical protein